MGVGVGLTPFDGEDDLFTGTYGMGMMADARGTLVSHPTREALENQIRMRRWSAYVGIAVFWTLAMLCYILLPGGGSGVVTADVYYAGVLVVTGVLWLIYYTVDGTRYKPIRVYSRGVSLPLGPGSERFVPWRWWSTKHRAFERLGMEDPWAREEGEGPKVRLYDWDDSHVDLDEQMTSLKQVKELAEERAGDPEYDSPEYVVGLRRSLSRSIVTTAITMTFITALLAYMAIGFPQMFGYAYGLVPVYIAFGGLLFFMMSLGMGFGDGIPKEWARLRDLSHGDLSPLKTTAAVVVAFLVVITAGMLVAMEEGMRHYDADATATPDPGWSVLAPGDYHDQEINASGPVRVGPGELLNLEDCTLTFDSAPKGQIGLYVAKGGSLTMWNTTLTTGYMELGYYFEVHGSAHIRGCLLERIYGNARWEQGDGGLELYSSEVSIEGTTFRETLTNAIMVVGTSPDIVSCEFVDIGDDGIEVQTGSPNIVGCNFTNCNYSMVLWGAEGRVEGCTFVDNARGVYMMGADTDVVDNTFVRTEYRAILRTADCSGKVEGNHFEDNGEDVVTKQWIGVMGTQDFPQVLGYGCIVIPVVVAIIGIAGLLVNLRKAEGRLRVEAPPGTIDELVYEPPGD